MLPGDYTLTIYRGRPLQLRLSFFQDEGEVPTDLTGCSVRAAIRAPGGSDPQVVLAAVIPNTPDTKPTDGVVVLTMTAEDAARLTGSYYSWTLVITDADGFPRQVLKGQVNVKIDDTL